MKKILLDTDIFSETGNLKHYHRIQNLGYDLKLENWKEIK